MSLNTKYNVSACTVLSTAAKRIVRFIGDTCMLGGTCFAGQVTIVLYLRIVYSVKLVQEPYPMPEFWKGTNNPDQM